MYLWLRRNNIYSCCIYCQGRGQDVTNLKRHATLEVAVIDNGDTITVDNYTTIDTAAVLDLADGIQYTVNLQRPQPCK